MSTQGYIIEENDKRNAQIHAKFNPITGEGSIGEREKVSIFDFPIRHQWLPVRMLEQPLIKSIMSAGTIYRFLKYTLQAPTNEEAAAKVIDMFVRVRCHYDFPFWAATFAVIKNKAGGDDIKFRLTRPQRNFVSLLEQKRLANEPIRIIMLKARQWGGSTTVQLYMAWLQLVHRTGLNSLIIAHQTAASDEIKDMYDRLIANYPLEMLYPQGAKYNLNETKMEGVGMSGAIHRVPQRNCKIKLGTAERPNSCRGGDYSLVHCSEVGMWKTTDGKAPEDIARSACAGVLLKPYTMIVYESTANGTGNFFQREYDAAKRGESQFTAAFVPWYDIDQYSLPFANDAAMYDFAANLYMYKDNEQAENARSEPGRYLWRLWENGATLEAIHWYVSERSKYGNHEQMAAEYPSDDIEAFAHSGARVFDAYRVEDLKKAGVRDALIRGEVCGDKDSGKLALANVHFNSDRQGALKVWKYPEIDANEKVANRYMVVVDIGGRSNSADYSVIAVFDRVRMIDGGPPEIVAQWRGHTDIDLLAWRSAQIAYWYDQALLIIESNTLETHDRDRDVDGDQSQFILNQIKDVYPYLYARRQSEEDIVQGLPRKYGFHTNTATKPMIISTLIKAVREKLYVERVQDAIDELIAYEKKPNGAYGAIVGRHDDILMTRAIGLHICFSEMEQPYYTTRYNPDRTTYLRRNKVANSATI